MIIYHSCGAINVDDRPLVKVMHTGFDKTNN